ncbi:MAG TPA: protein kinase [Terriglobales bacterium]|nr:protein kinase [Terriglobales bacterium]
MLDQTISHYHIIDKLGVGGMGVVYEAEDTRLHRHVALKFLPEEFVKDPRVLERFRREARAASQLNHPNICTIHDIDDNDGHPFIVMEKLDGESLKQRLRGGALPLDEALDIAVQIASALMASHEKGVIHRDIKPANIFLTKSGQVKILDFGLAKVAPESSTGEAAFEDSLTALGVIPGTAVYMSPEQARSEELDRRSDLFSFGVVLYEMVTGKKPFTGTNIVTTLHSVLNDKPLSPLISNPNLPPDLEAIIGKALEKDKTKRYWSADEMKADLQRVQRKTDSGMSKAELEKSPPPKASKTFQKSSSRLKYLLIVTLGLLITVLAAVGTWWFRQRSGGTTGLNTIAVLPLQNLSGDSSVDYLRFALADEIANVLTYSRSLDVRPTMATRKFSGPDVDPEKVGRQVHVGVVLGGHFMQQGNQLIVTIEAINVATNRLIWQSTLRVGAQDLISLQSQLASHVRQGLLPQLGAAAGFMEAGTKPKNQDAYDLYLRTLAISRDPGPNKDAIGILEEAVQLDPTYAPTWQALGLRDYYDGTYGDGGETMRERSKTAYERALALDSNLSAAAGNLIVLRVERGDLGKAYDGAKQMVTQRPQSAFAHFTLSYVLRYAGMLDQASGECETALALDPGNFEFRSCAWTFLQLGQQERALNFIQLDSGSEWANWMMPFVYLRESKIHEAQQAIKKVADNPHYHRDLMEVCVQLRPASELEGIVQKTEAAVLADPDPEPHYYEGAVVAFCGKPDVAARMIHSAIDKNYCSSSALKSDPLLGKLRASSEFTQLTVAASECQKRFQASVTQPLQ